MRLAVFVSASLVAILAFCGSASATIIADFMGDFQSPTPSTGWAYMYNGSGSSIGNSSGYVTYVWNSTGDNNQYCSNAGWKQSDASTKPQPASWGYVQKNRLSVCHGALEGSWGAGSESPLVDHYTILAYTVQSGEQGAISITDSTISVNPVSGQSGVDMGLRVYVNNTLISDMPKVVKYVTDASDNVASNTFNMTLGTLNVGDKVYVALGPDGNSYRDYTNTFQFKLTSVPIPEPGTMMMLAVGLLAYAWRKRK